MKIANMEFHTTLNQKLFTYEICNMPGGYATTFRRGAFNVEVGLHEMDGPGQGDMKTRIFNDLDVFNNVEFLRLPEFYRFVNDRVDVTVPHNPETAAEILTARFPGETEGIKAFFSQIMNPRKNLMDPAQHGRSVGEFLDSIISDDELKLVLLGNLGYFHDDPYSLSLAYYTVSQGSYFSGGGSFIRGGSQKLSDHLAGFIRSHGGEVLLSHVVTGLRTSQNIITGVTYQKNKKNNAIILKAEAVEIIANTAMPNVATLLPEPFGNGLRDQLKEQQTGASLLTLYLGYDKPLRELGYRHYSTAVYGSTILSQKDILKNNRGDFAARSFIFTDYSQVDSALTPAGKGVGALCCIDYPENWEGLGRKEYVAKKATVASLFIERLEKLIPGIKEVISYHEVATPLTLKRYTLNPGGAVYGFAQTPGRKPIDLSGMPENLHFASAWGKTGGGFSGVIYGGYLCAMGILRKKPAAR
jgi:all-trans-retinol 13,14-reductase